MSGLVTPDLVLEVLTDLYLAFPTHRGMRDQPQETARVYFEALAGLPADAFHAAALHAKRTCRFFPAIAVLHEAIADWTKHNTVHIDPVRGTAEESWCPRCQSALRWVTLWRPARDSQNYVLLSDDGRHVRLEEHERWLCRCAAPGAFAPMSSVGEPYTPLGPIRGQVELRPGPRAVRGSTGQLGGTTANVGDVAEGLAETVMVHGRLNLPRRAIPRSD